MNEALSKIGFYHGLFLVCLAGALILFAVSLVLFIRRDIRSAIAFLAGHRAKREIRRLEAENGWQGPIGRGRRREQRRRQGPFLAFRLGAVVWPRQSPPAPCWLRLDRQRHEGRRNLCNGFLL